MNSRTWASSALGLGLLVVGACEGPARLLPCGPEATYSSGRCWDHYELRVNSVGYLEGRPKRAVAPRAGKFEVRDSSGRVAYRGTTGAKVNAPDTNEVVYLVDFGAFDEVGTYYIALADGGRSPEFSIGPEGAEAALKQTMLGLYGLRCGEEVHIAVESYRGPDTEFHHEACHLSAAKLDLVGTGTHDDTGGWHDAGDYGKYTVNGAFAVAFLLKAYQHYPAFSGELKLSIPESGGALPDLLDEAKVELQWLLKVQLEDGSFSHKVTAKKFESTILPENDLSERYFSPVGTAATGSAVGVLALAARLYAEFDREFSVRCLKAAQRGHAFLSGHPELIQPDLKEFTTGAYLAQDGDSDERLWAAIELYEATGQMDYLKEFESALSTPTVQEYFDWYGFANLAYDSYLRSRSAERDRSRLQLVSAAFVRAADDVAARAEADPYGRGSSIYSWGSNGATARLALALAGGYYVTERPEYLNAALAQLDYLFGRNPFGRSFVTGVGFFPPSRPHHRASTADQVEAPWPGLLVGGPHKGGDEPLTPFDALKWQDKSDDYNHNEVAINWNTALVYALTMALGADGTSGACSALGAGGACTTGGHVGGLGGLGGLGGSGGASR